MKNVYMVRFDLWGRGIHENLSGTERSIPVVCTTYKEAANAVRVKCKEEEGKEIEVLNVRCLGAALEVQS